MRKLLFCCLLTAVVTAVQAQTKIVPLLQKGLVKAYTITTTTQLPGQKTITTTAEATYTIVDATPEGYTLDIVNSNFTSNAMTDDIVSQIFSAAAELMTDQKITVALNSDGQPQRILNYGELRKLQEERCEKLVTKLMEQAPMLAQFMPKETLNKTIMSHASEENMLKILKDEANVLTLNGKTLAIGTQEDYVNEKNMKMKRLYFVNGNTITSNAVLNMTQDEMKTLIIAEVENSMSAEQAKMVTENIDMLMSSGQLKLDMQEKAEYKLEQDNWVSNIKVDTVYETMGTKTTVTMTVSKK